MKFLDRQADFIREKCPPQIQMRIGIIMMYVSILFFVYMPFSGEQLGIYLMSALALVFGGLGFVVTAVLAKSQDEGS